MDCCYIALTLLKSNSGCWSSTEQISPSSLDLAMIWLILFPLGVLVVCGNGNYRNQMLRFGDLEQIMNNAVVLKLRTVELFHKRALVDEVCWGGGVGCGLNYVHVLKCALRDLSRTRLINIKLEVTNCVKTGNSVFLHDQKSACYHSWVPSKFDFNIWRIWAIIFLILFFILGILTANFCLEITPLVIWYAHYHWIKLIGKYVSHFSKL